MALGVPRMIGSSQSVPLKRQMAAPRSYWPLSDTDPETVPPAVMPYAWLCTPSASPKIGKTLASQVPLSSRVQTAARL